MNCNMDFLIWNVMGDDGSDWDGLGWNGFQSDNTPFNLMGDNGSYCDRKKRKKKLNVSQREGFSIEHDGI